MDSLDLYLYKQRKAFEIMASQELGLEQLVIKKDLGRILFQLEELQRERLDAEQEAKSKQIELSDAERDEAHELLLSANLMQQILDDFEACGIVGEESNKLVGYLACTSRKLNKPLAVLIQSSSAAGKSSLLESILAFMPPEEVEKFSAMTGQSLYYMGDSDLQHKILAVIEEEGAEKASYALKLLQSEGELMIASTGKDPNTGRHSTEEYQVKGPVALLLTTTSSETDEELANRCLVLTVDEGQQQTELIHRLQRDWDSLEEQIHSNLRAQILRRHQNAQRLLKPVLVSNPFRNDLTFRSDLTRTRRDHPKYLTLIRVIAFLHQCQREKKTIVKNGQDYQYIEVTLEDIEWANRLAHSVMGQSLDELTPQSRKLINAIYNMVLRIGESETIDLSEVRFTQREVREFTGWSQYQVKTHMRRLVEYEYLRLHRGRSGQSWLYELIYEPHKSESGRQMLGLIDVNKLRQRYDSNRVHSIKPMEHSEESREQPGVLGLHPVNFKKSKAL